ncbi:cytochrome P450 [Salininema proteolyticum]|uniref:Cytochrome P450 n=1 Tax=Salininema proteolyticum TaxID=1607685 RepID=A0ABV8TVC5_9ACTN
MSDTTAPTEIPFYPMERAEGCPFAPPPRLMRIQEEAPVQRVRLWDGSTPWLITRYEDQRAVLGDPRVSADLFREGYPAPAPIVGERSNVSFIFKDDPEHNRLRRMVTKPFTLRGVKAMRPAVQRIVDDRIDAMLAGPKPADLVRDFALPVPSLVICDLLGVPYEDHDFFQEHSKRLLDQSPDQAPRAESRDRLVEYLARLLRDKRDRPADDVMSTLAPRVDSGELSEIDAAQTGILLLVAGHETTANMITLGTLALLQNPRALAALREADDPAVVDRAVEELLRYLSIVHNGRRRVALEDLEVAGQKVRRGEGLVIPTESGNWDESVFPGAAELDIDRDARRHMAFGFGVHQCLGQPLARLELHIVYSTLYRRLPALALACDPADLSYRHGSLVYGVHEMPVTW